MLLPKDLVVWNSEIDISDKDSIGLEIASLGEISQHRVKIIPRIVLTANAFKQFTIDNNLTIQIQHLLGSIDHTRHDSVAQIARYLKKLITTSVINKEIYAELFKKIESLDSRKIVLVAHYFKDGKLIGSARWTDLEGESVVAEHIRIAYAHLFSTEYLIQNTIHQKNHHSVSACLFIEPVLQSELGGQVATQGRNKSEAEIEAHTFVRYTYHKKENLIKKAEVLGHDGKKVLAPKDLLKLITIAKAAENAFYLPQVIYWIKYKGDFLITKVLPSSDAPVYNDTYHTLIKNVTLHPGVTIGRLRVIDEKSRSIAVLQDEIIQLKVITKDLMIAVKKARGLILEEEPDQELKHLLKSIGIPTIVKKNDRFLYSTGDVISLNATTGEIKRGSMLVS